MGDVKDYFDLLEEEYARQLMKRQVVLWAEDVKPILLKLGLHEDPEVKEAAGKLQQHIVWLMSGQSEGSPQRATAAGRQHRPRRR